jgi:TetR/AcrR family transcriptional repressor of nem operon
VRNTELMTGRMKDEDGAIARRKALLAICAMAGAVGFARLVDDEALSEEILASVREELLRIAQ